MAETSQAPATKQDVQLLMKQIGAYYDKTEKQIMQLKGDMEQWKEEVKRHFDVVAENIHREVAGAHKDEIESLKDTDRRHGARISRLEEHTGLIAA